MHAATRHGEDWTTSDSLRAWHVRVVAKAEGGTPGEHVVENIVLEAGNRVAKADSLSRDGVAVFSGALAHTIVAGDAFDVVATVHGGQRTCTVTAKDKLRIGL